MPSIGPTFGDEIIAAGLGGLPFSWGSDGTFQFDPRMTQAQINAVLAVSAAHDPTKIRPNQRSIVLAKIAAIPAGPIHEALDALLELI